MIGHLGARISALLDGQLGREEEERAWAHVHQCHQCRDLVEREGWVKTRLAGLERGAPAAPAGLKGSLLGGATTAPWPAPPGDVLLELAAHRARPRRAVGLAALGGGAAGAAMMGVLALGAAPASAPTLDRRLPLGPLAMPTPASVSTMPQPTAFIGPVRRTTRP